MEELLKNRLTIILAVLALIFFLTGLSSCINNYRQGKELNKEMAKRIELEELMINTSEEKIKLEEEVNRLARLLKEQSLTLEIANKETNRLRDELLKMTKLKEALEENLKEALTGRSRR